MNFKNLKNTLHGVECEKTKSVFKELRKRGFRVGLEDGGGGNTYKILSFINGKYFAISMASSVFCKNYSRGFHKWQHFNCIDDLVMASISTKERPPTPNQLSYIKCLLKRNGIKDSKEPETIIEAMELIDELKNRLP